MIHIKDSGFPGGTVIVAAATQPRFYEFQISLDNLRAPEGTKLTIVRSCDIAQNFNDGVKGMRGEWAWFMGDDHSFDKNFLMRLLKYNVDIVVPVTACKVPPWMPCIMHGPTDGDSRWHENMFLYDWDEVSGHGLLPLPKGDFIGQAGMLVKKHVLDSIGYPWFKCGQFDPGRLQEDMYFCYELQQKGFTINIDQEHILEHYFINGVSASRYNGKWVPALVSKHGVTMALPDAKPIFHPERTDSGRWEALPVSLPITLGSDNKVIIGGKNDSDGNKNADCSR